MINWCMLKNKDEKSIWKIHFSLYYVLRMFFKSGIIKNILMYYFVH